MKHSQSESPQLESVNFLKTLNLVLVILDIIFAIGISAGDITMLLIVAFFHSLILFPSIMYQASPKVAQETTFRMIAMFVGVLSIALATLNYIGMERQDDATVMMLYWIVFIFFTLPGAIVGGSLILILFVNKEKQQPRYIMVPQNYMNIEEPMV